ncbi:MAG: heliorhodopsin HeR [Chloroflexi bacterium]|nr:heliorhodopsin HeR [Chloroflexota bacterium]
MTAHPLTISAQPNSMGRLRLANAVVGLAHLAQAALILWLSNGFSIPVVASFAEGPPGSALPAAEAVFALAIGPAVALFLLLAAVDHLLVATPGLVGWYERGLRNTINYARWAEYSVSASVMIVLIAMITGITNLYALVGIFAVNASMILFGLLMERVNQGRERIDWWPFWLGSLAAVVPWLAIAIAVAGAEAGEGDVPGFVYGIIISLFLFFNSFAINMWLQYRKVGPWRDYLYGERAYIVLSLAAKSALAWQVFGGTLAS